MDEQELAWVAQAAGAESAKRGERVQSLWSGYGEILRVRLSGGERATAIVKSVKPPAQLRGKRPDASHARKCRSYDVEMEWYRTYAARCDDACRVPGFIDGR